MAPLNCKNFLFIFICILLINIYVQFNVIEMYVYLPKLNKYIYWKSKKWLLIFYFFIVCSYALLHYTSANGLMHLYFIQCLLIIAITNISSASLLLLNFDFQSIWFSSCYFFFSLFTSLFLRNFWLNALIKTEILTAIAL